MSTEIMEIYLSFVQLSQKIDIHFWEKMININRIHTLQINKNYFRALQIVLVNYGILTSKKIYSTFLF